MDRNWLLISSWNSDCFVVNERRNNTLYERKSFNSFLPFNRPMPMKRISQTTPWFLFYYYFASTSYVFFSCTLGKETQTLLTEMKKKCFFFLQKLKFRHFTIFITWSVVFLFSSFIRSFSYSLKWWAQRTHTHSDFYIIIFIYFCILISFHINFVIFFQPLPILPVRNTLSEHWSHTHAYTFIYTYNQTSSPSFFIR